MKMLMTLSVVLAAVMLTTASPAASAVCGVPAIEPFPPVERIVGGIEAKPNSWPWMCSLELEVNGTWFLDCGCFVLNSVTVLTGAQCLFEVDAPVRIRCGIHYLNTSNPHEQTIAVSNRTSHELFNYHTNDYDVAILKLSTPLTFNDFVSPVCLPQKDVEPGTKAVATGWGSTSGESRDPTNELRQVTVPIVSQEECATDYGTGTITDRMLCAGDAQGGKDSCMGDAGDPLVIKRDNVWEVQGIASWGRGCAEKGFPGVYTRVTQLIDWIKQRL